MLLHFKSNTEKDKDCDVVVNVGDHNEFESLKTIKFKKYFVLSFCFTELRANERHESEADARSSIKNKLTLLGFENAEQISSDVCFMEEEL